MPSTNTTHLQTEVVIVGAGPAGCTLGYLLARSGIDTILLERQSTLSREFRGYFFQPRVVQLFDEMGLLDHILTLSHDEVQSPHVVVYNKSLELFDLTTDKRPHNFGLLMEQPPLLQLLIDRAAHYPHFDFRDQTTVHDLIIDGNQITGVRAYDRTKGTDLEIHSRVVIGADGRYSTVRKAAGIDPGLLDSKLELLWFKLPREVIHEAVMVRFGPGGVILYFGLGESEAQLGWFIEKGSYPQLKVQGIEHFHEQLFRVDPSLEDILPEHLPSFDECSLLHIEPGMCDTWATDGLLLIGDAAHVASPVGGQGNSLAIQDAVITHAVLTNALTRDLSPLPAELLSQVEAQRRPAVTQILRFQRRAERILTWMILSGNSIPDSIRRPLLTAFFTVVPKTPVMHRTRDLMAWGPTDIHVDTTAFIK